MIFFKNFRKYKNIIHGVLERKDRNNILRVLKKLGLKTAKNDNLIFAEQIHGSNVYFCPENVSGYLNPVRNFNSKLILKSHAYKISNGVKFQADGLVSKTPGQILVIKTADCLPILIYSPKEKMVGAIHAGRKGIIRGIIERAIKMFGHDRSLICGIGPHIRSCCYYLRGEAKKYVKIPLLREYIQKRKNKLYFNLTELVIGKLVKLGVKKENIEDCQICTFCQSERFYSARKMETQPDFYQKEQFPCPVVNQRFYYGPCFYTFIGLK